MDGIEAISCRRVFELYPRSFLCEDSGYCALCSTLQVITGVARPVSGVSKE